MKERTSNKAKKLIILILLAYLFPCANMYSQGQVLDIPKMTPVSPNAASFGQFGAYSVGTYTGLPGISIPLYEIDLDGRKIPITLSYNASGIRVAQEASSVGLGWALNAGGMITKEIRGWNDFYKNWATNPNQPVADDYGYYYNNWPEWPECDANNNLVPDEDNDILTEMLTAKDTQPDMFHFNFGGYSGTMFFEKNPGDRSNVVKPYVLTPTEYLDISYHLDESSWVIVDPYGYTYRFIDKEWTELRTASSQYYESRLTTNKQSLERRKKMPHIETAWVLNSIESPYGNKVTFNYATEKVSTPILLSEPLLMSVPLLGTQISRPTISSYDYSYSFILQKTLSGIEFNGGSVLFSKSDRSDLDSTVPSGSNLAEHDGLINPQKVDMIRVKDKAGNDVKKIALGYEYMGNTSSYLSCRLMLKSVTETGNEGNPLMYKFSYKGGNLPDKNSLATDIWGYYNRGSLSNTTRTLPGMIKDANLNNPQGYPHGAITTGKDVLPDETNMQVGTLESIEYPTKGKTKFIYEQHEFRDKFRASVSIASKDVTHNDPTNPAHTGLRQVLGSEFRLLEGTYVGLKAFYHNMSGVAIPSHSAMVQLERQLPDGQFGLVSRLFLDMVQNNGEVSEQEVYVPAGVYRTVITKEIDQYGNLKPCGYFISATVSTYKPYELNRGGGLRIKEIQNIEGNTVITRKKYGYKRNGETSGRLLLKPDCANMALFDTRNATSLQELASICALGNNVMAYGYVTPYISLNGASANIGYSYVEEYAEDAEGRTLGKTTYTYFNEPVKKKILLPGFPHQFHPGNGSLLQTCEYDDAGVMVQKTEREYSKKNVAGANLVKGLVLHSVPGVPRVGGKFYDLQSERWSLDREVTTLYSDNGSNNLTTAKTYQYHPTYWMVNKEQATDSKSQTVETRTKFPGDYADAVHTKMRTKNMTGIPIETIKMTNNEVFAGQKTLYQDTLGIIVPKEVHTLETVTPSTLNAYTGLFKASVTFDKHNAKGKVLQASGRDHIPVTYLWSYGNQYLVAEIKNATYQEVETAAALVGLDLNLLADSQSPDMYKLNALRDQLNDAHISTFTYKPLVGVTSVTDSSKKVTHYEYDSLNRLKEIYIYIDHQKVILEAYEYNYANN